MRNDSEQIEDAETKTPYDLACELLDADVINGCPTIWHIRGHWQIWTGTHYSPVCNEVIEQRVLDFLKKRSPNLVTRSRIRNVVELLRVVQHREIDSVPCWLKNSNLDPGNLFPVQNGLLRLSTSEILQHDPTLFGTAAVQYEYLERTACPRWCEFLAELWPNDPRAREILQEWFGYCLSYDTSQQKIIAIVGPARSGKSTIARILTQLLGSGNVASPSIRDLSGHFGLWGLLCKKLAIIPDAVLPRPCPALEELLKSVSGEDAVDVHRKRLPPLTGVRLNARLMLLANELPTFHDQSGALERRLITLRTTRSFFGSEDVTLTDTLTEELPGILNWAIEGRNRLHARGHFEYGEPSIDLANVAGSLPDSDRIRRIVVEYGSYERRRRNRRKDRKRRVHRHPK